MDCIGIEVSNTALFSFWGFNVELATAENLGHWNVTPSGGAITYPSVSRLGASFH